MKVVKRGRQIEECPIKVIQINGRKCEVPGWVNWVAQNKKGRWYGYSERPNKTIGDTVWELVDGRGIYIFTSNESENWEETLRKI